MISTKCHRSLEVDFGIDRTEAWGKALDGARFGLLANMGSVDRNLQYAWDVLAKACSGRLTALFSPQHGLWGEQQANMFETAHGRHERLGVPVHSLYAESRRPSPEMLDGLDVLVIDLQDVGTRVYTFVWTATYCLEACAKARVRVLVLDRPNPIGGTIVEGPPLDLAFRSFVGLASIPMRHGLTLGELLRLFNAERAIGANLHVVSMTGWTRSMRWCDLDRPWVLPSPNVPRIEGVEVYPGQVLLEGTNLSEGRGTTTSFEWCGAPFVDPHRLIDELGRLELPGVFFRPIRFVPTFDKWKGESCGGVALHVVDGESFRPWRTTVAILAACRKLWPDEFAWLDPPYEYEPVKMPIDIIDGSSRLREAIDASGGEIDAASLDEWDREAWRRRIEPCLLYR
ncbi:MAG: DUF1343 domain-containing protein [Planctomycetaceae bacterium]